MIATRMRIHNQVSVMLTEPPERATASYRRNVRISCLAVLPLLQLLFLVLQLLLPGPPLLLLLLLLLLVVRPVPAASSGCTPSCADASGDPGVPCNSSRPPGSKHGSE